MSVLEEPTVTSMSVLKKPTAPTMMLLILPMVSVLDSSCSVLLGGAANFLHLYLVLACPGLGLLAGTWTDGSSNKMATLLACMALLLWALDT